MLSTRATSGSGRSSAENLSGSCRATSALRVPLRFAARNGSKCCCSHAKAGAATAVKPLRTSASAVAVDALPAVVAHCLLQQRELKALCEEQTDEVDAANTRCSLRKGPLSLGARQQTPRGRFLFPTPDHGLQIGALKEDGYLDFSESRGKISTVRKHFSSLLNLDFKETLGTGSSPRHEAGCACHDCADYGKNSERHPYAGVRVGDISQRREESKKSCHAGRHDRRLHASPPPISQSTNVVCDDSLEYSLGGATMLPLAAHSCELSAYFAKRHLGAHGCSRTKDVTRMVDGGGTIVICSFATAIGVSFTNLPLPCVLDFGAAGPSLYSQNLPRFLKFDLGSLPTIGKVISRQRWDIWLILLPCLPDNPTTKNKIGPNTGLENGCSRRWRPWSWGRLRQLRQAWGQKPLTPCWQMSHDYFPIHRKSNSLNAAP